MSKKNHRRRRSATTDRLDLAQPHPVLRAARAPGVQRWAAHVPPPNDETLFRGDNTAACDRCGDPIPPRSQRPGSLRCPKCRDKRGALTPEERAARSRAAARARRERREAMELRTADADAAKHKALAAERAAAAANVLTAATLALLEEQARKREAAIARRDALIAEAEAASPLRGQVLVKHEGRAKKVGARGAGSTIPSLGKVKNAFKLGPVPKRLRPGTKPKPRVVAAGAAHREWTRAVEWSTRVRPEAISERDWEMLRLWTVSRLTAPAIAQEIGGTVRPEAVRKALARARAAWKAAQSA